MEAIALSADSAGVPDLELCPPATEASPDVSAESSASAGVVLPYGRWVLHGMDCLMVRRPTGTLACFVRIPHAHELYGRTDIQELSLALDCPHGITYSAAGAQDWYIGSLTRGSWEDAWDLLDDLSRQLVEFSETDEIAPDGDRVSGVHSRAVMAY